MFTRRYMQQSAVYGSRIVSDKPSRVRMYRTERISRSELGVELSTAFVQVTYTKYGKIWLANHNSQA